MNHGFVRVCAATPKIQVADPEFNGNEILKLMEEGRDHHAFLMVFPELCLTGYTCNDLFWHAPLLEKAKETLKKLVDASADFPMLLFVGLPWEYQGKLYNVTAAVCQGKLLGLVPKTHLPNYSEFYEMRHFTSGNQRPVMVPWKDGQVPMGTNLLFQCDSVPGLTIGAEICEDVWVPCPPSISHAMAGATVIVNCSASDETVGKDSYRMSLISGQSARLVCGYIYSNAGEGESTQDLVFGGHNIIAENGTMLVVSERF